MRKADRWLLRAGSFFERSFEDDEIVCVAGIPSRADDVISHFDGEVDEFALGVEAFAADEFVIVIEGPGALRVVELASDPDASCLREDSAEPVVEHAGFEFEPDPESDGLFVESSQECEAVVTPEESASEEIDLSLGAEDAIVDVDGLRKQSGVGDDDVGLCQGWESVVEPRVMFTRCVGRFDEIDMIRCRFGEWGWQAGVRFV